MNTILTVGIIAIIGYVIYWFARKGLNKNSIEPLRIGMIMAFAALAGFIFITIGSLIEVDFIPTNGWKEDFRKLIISLIHNVGQSLFVAGFIGVVFEMKSIKVYFEKRISDILINDEYLKFQSETELMRLRQRATQNLYEKKSKVVDPELILLDEEICKSLTEPYYKSYKEKHTYNLSADSKYIIKNVTTRFELVNPEKNAVSLLEFCNPRVRFKSIPNVVDKDIRKLIGFDIWVDEEVTTSVLDSIGIDYFSDKTHELDDEYTINTKFTYLKNDIRPIKFQNKLKVKLEEERKIPLNDLTVSFRLETLAKYLEIGMVFENIDVEFIGNLYGTMTNPRDGINIDKDTNSIYLECCRWMLKGNGVFINVVPKDWDITKKIVN